MCKETLLSCDTSFTARAIVQLYVNVMARDGFSEEESLSEDRGALDFREVLCANPVVSILLSCWHLRT